MANDLQPVKEEQHGNVTLRWYPLADFDEQKIYTSLPTATAEERAKVLSYQHCPARCADDVMGTVLEIEDYVIHPALVPDDKTGGYKSIQRTVLFGSTMTPVAFCSVGVIKSMHDLVYAEHRKPPW